MAGRTSFAKLREAMSPEARANAALKYDELRDRMDLAELRRAYRFSQEELAQVLDVKQSAVAKMEKRTDAYISTIRRFIEAMGGTLEITARFAGRSILIKNFSELAKKEN